MCASLEKSWRRYAVEQYIFGCLIDSEEMLDRIRATSAEEMEAMFQEVHADVWHTYKDMKPADVAASILAVADRFAGDSLEGAVRMFAEMYEDELRDACMSGDVSDNLIADLQTLVSKAQ